MGGYLACSVHYFAVFMYREHWTGVNGMGISYKYRGYLVSHMGWGVWAVHNMGMLQVSKLLSSESTARLWVQYRKQL